MCLAVVTILGSCTNRQFQLNKEVSITDRSGDFNIKTNSPKMINTSCNVPPYRWYGTLQALNESQQKEIYIFERCINNGDSFETILVSNFPSYINSSDKVDYLKEKFNNSQRDGASVKGFTSFIFKLPLNELNDPLLDDPYKFPCNVTAYFSQTENNNFFMIESILINSWEEYQQFQFECISKVNSLKK